MSARLETATATAPSHRHERLSEKKGPARPMNASDIRSICVVGSGTMGSQIALRCAVYGFQVFLVDTNREALSQAIERGETLLRSEPRAPVLRSIEVDEVVSRLHPTTSLREGTGDADFVIEAVPEDLALKRSVFAELDHTCRPDTILATNSSSLRVSLVEDATERPEKVINTHFFIDSFEHPGVEIMRGSRTSDEVFEATVGLARRLGLVPLVLKKEITGFMLARIWRAIKKESLHLVDGGYADPEDIDRAFILAFGTQDGPFQRMDQIGLDVILAIENTYYRETGDESDRPPALLTDKVRRGELGPKSGRGFYEYPDASFLRPGWLSKEDHEEGPDDAHPPAERMRPVVEEHVTRSR
jgi:3-hydroxybutyryl-CoA dehydrogenase